MSTLLSVREIPSQRGRIVTLRAERTHEGGPQQVPKWHLLPYLYGVGRHLSRSIMRIQGHAVRGTKHAAMTAPASTSPMFNTWLVEPTCISIMHLTLVYDALYTLRPARNIKLDLAVSSGVARELLGSGLPLFLPY